MGQARGTAGLRCTGRRLEAASKDSLSQERENTQQSNSLFARAHRVKYNAAMPVHLATHLNEADTRAQLIDPQVNRTWQDKTLRLETQDKLEQAR
jgi:hypothetical protein